MNSSNNSYSGSLRNFLLHLHPHRLERRKVNFWQSLCLGGLSAFLFFLLLGTGIILALFYTPGDLKSQYGSIVTIEQVIAYGWLIRGLHRWAGQGMVITVLLHMVRVVLQGAYRPPRQANWVIGVVLMLLTVLLDFSGYLLLGDATSLLAQRVISSIIALIPGGELLQSGIFGDSVGGLSAGIRIYAWHCFALPAALIVLMLWHFYRVRRDGFRGSL